MQVEAWMGELPYGVVTTRIYMYIVTVVCFVEYCDFSIRKQELQPPVVQLGIISSKI